MTVSFLHGFFVNYDTLVLSLIYCKGHHHMNYAYIRISTDKQNESNQKHEIILFAEKNNLKIDEWCSETISSRTRLNERKLGNVLKKLKKGDILIATELSRLGRNLLEVMGILKACLEKDCQVWTLKENYRLGADIQSKVLAFAFSLAAEIERQLISERTKNALKRLKEEGKHLGRPYGVSYYKLKRNHLEIRKLLRNKTPKTKIANILGCSWATLQRYIKDFDLK